MNRVLFLYGLPDDNDAKIVLHRGRQELLVMGSANVYPALRPYFDAQELLLMGDAPEHHISWGADPAVVFNQISDPDTHPISLNRAEELCQRLNAPVVNPPDRIRKTRRDEVASMLQSVPGLVVPRTMRCRLSAPEDVSVQARQHDLQYPLLVRAAGSHGGHNLVRVDSPNDHLPLHRLPLDQREYYLTEFVDFKSSDGLYRKCRIAIVGGKPLMRHWVAHQDWNVHTAMGRQFMEQRGELLQEGTKMRERFDAGLAAEYQPTFQSIFQAIQLDYFGVDCNFLEDGRLLIFEANANMNMLPPTRPGTVPTEQAKHERQRLVDALRETIQSRIDQQGRLLS